jgi:Zn ribbon nucleic-acid-binding protein
MNCPNCQSADVYADKLNGTFSLVTCDECGHVEQREDGLDSRADVYELITADR